MNSVTISQQKKSVIVTFQPHISLISYDFNKINDRGFTEGVQATSI